MGAVAERRRRRLEGAPLESGRLVRGRLRLPAQRLVIEIDGGVHERDEVVLNDHYRQQAIEALGWTVIRFTNAEALADPARIDAAIRDHAKTLGL